MSKQPAEMYSTVDSHGAPIWVRLPPPSRWDYQRKWIRRAALYVAGALVLAFMVAAAIVIMALMTARPAQGATDNPGRATWACRHKLVSVSPRYTVYRWVCVKVAK